MTEIAALRSLRLDERTFRIEAAKITHVGDLTFVKSCARLEKLTVQFNATTNFPTPEQFVSAPMLRHLNVCTSPAGDVDAVAVFLDKTFPRLQKLSYGSFIGIRFLQQQFNSTRRRRRRSSLG